MSWSPMNRGKYKGKTLPQIIFTDPDWFFWAYENKIFQGNRLARAQEIYHKARAIRVPQSGGRKKVVEYIIDETTGKFGGIYLIDEPEGPHPFEISDVIDMSVPRRISERDKTGYRNFLAGMQGIIFGKSKHMMTKKRCEEFFDNEDNFVPGKNTILKI